MERYTRLAFWLSSKFNKKIYFGSLKDLNNYYFEGKGYSITTKDLECPNLKEIKPNSCRLLDLALELVVTHKDYISTKSILVEFCIPIYHIVKFLDQDTGSCFLNFCYTKQENLFNNKNTTKLLLHTGFKLYKNAVERSFWVNHDYQIYCLIRVVTDEFTCYVNGEDEDLFKKFGLIDTPVNRWLLPIFERIKGIVINVFGVKYKTLLGNAIIQTILNAYLIVHELPTVPFVYKKVKIICSNKRKMNEDRLDEKLRGFICGTFGPYTQNECYMDDRKEQARHNFKPKFLCEMQTNPDIKYISHINVQVIHVKILSKQVMLYNISGKCLVHTMSKKKTIAGSSYKIIKPDFCIPTPNTINFNIHGYDMGLILALLLFKPWKRVAVCDRSEPAVISHCRYSSNSLQNGILDTNNYRYNMMIKYPTKCIKVPHFPVVDVCNVGLLHRESLLINFNKKISQRDIPGLYYMISNCSEKDNVLEEFIYNLEKENSEILDNHIMGIVKILYVMDKLLVASKIQSKLRYDRMLIAFNPKTTRSEFADKSKFDAESKGKASKKIKIVDQTRDRKNFLLKICKEYPDVFIDPANANARGKWSYLDKLNHSSDTFFYSNFAKFYIRKLKNKFGVNKNMDSMLSLMQREIN